MEHGCTVTRNLKKEYGVEKVSRIYYGHGGHQTLSRLQRVVHGASWLDIIMAHYFENLAAFSAPTA